MKLHYPLVRLATVGVFVGLVLSVAAGQFIDQPKLGYSVTLPDDWVQLPYTVVSNYTRTIQKMANGGFNESYDDGFQRSAQGQWFKYPYILVQIKETGRVPERQLAQMKTLRSDVQRGADMAAKKLSAVVSDMSVGDTYYDATNKCILVRSTASVAGVGDIKALTCGYLTERGIIFFHCYALSGQFDDLLPVFQKLLRSVRIKDGLRYRPHLSDRTGFDFGRVGRSGLIGGVVGGLAGLVLGLFKMIQKKGQKKGPPPLP